MSFSAALLLVALSYRPSTSTMFPDVCPSPDDFDLTLRCYEYGFCSSCVSASGCAWCEPTSRCVSVYSDCAEHDTYGLTTLNQCTSEYINNNRERPDIRTTSYSPQLSEIMNIYSYYAYKIDDDDLNLDFINQYDTFTLTEDSIQTFAAELTTITEFACFSRISDDFTSDWLNLDADELYKEICEFIGLPTFHDVVNFIVDFGLNVADETVDTIATGLENAGVDISSLKFDADVAEYLSGWLDITDLGKERVVVGLDDVNQAIVVSFRGTEAVSTWLGFVRFCMVNWDKSSLYQLKKDYDVSLDVQIMETFSNAYNDLKDEFYSYVQQLIEENPDYDLFITGHSLGGALANIFALDLFADYYNANTALDASKIKVYTYGQPRVGNDGFASLVNQILDYEYYRVVNSKDPVPMVPFWFMGYRQCGIEIHYAVGDYSNGFLCQYRECTFLDPYEDTSCRARYYAMDKNDLFGIIGEILDVFFDLFAGANKLNWIITNTIEFPLSLIDSVQDHCGYPSLGKYGHCGNFSASENILKGIDRTIYRDIDTDNYRCVNPFDDVSNIISTIFDGGGAFDNLNGCGNAGDDMLCCLGPLRSGSVCVDVGNDGTTLLSQATCPQSNIGEHCLKDSHCQDTLLNIVTCEHGVCEDEGADIGDKCVVDANCAGWNLLGEGVACCQWRCTQKQENYLGLFVCPNLCRKKWYSWFGTCAYEYDGTCASFDVNTDDCSLTEDNWNLGIGLGDSKYANTDSRIMFSYCINRICSDWYYLNHCGHDDFEGSCHYQYFIVPNMTQEIEAALHSSDAYIDLEFATCGSKSGDGVQIDQIGVGHEGYLLTIDTFERGDDAFCRFSGTDEHSFSIDSDRCKTVSLSYNLGTTSSVMFSGLISSVSYSDICDYDNLPSCASESTDCESRGLSQSGGAIVNNPEVKVLEISDRLMWLLSGFVVVLLLISFNNLQKCRRKKNIKYHIVNVESSSEDC